MTDSGPALIGPALIAQFARSEIGPYLATHPEDRYPLPLVRRLAELGAFAAAVPIEHGGAGWTRPDTALIGYELGRGWQPLAGLVGTHLKLCRQVLAHGTARQRSLLPAMAGGETVFARAYHEQGIAHPCELRTVAIRRGSAGVLSGRKNWVTNARHADRVLAIARSDDAVVGIIVDPGRPGVIIGPELPRPGMRGVSLAEITFTDYEFDPDRDVLGGWGHDLTDTLLSHDVTSYVARAMGSADAVFEHAVRFVRDGLERRPAEVRGAMRLRMGELTTRVATMRTVWQALLNAASAETGPMTPDTAKVFCTATLQEVVCKAARLCGGAGYADPADILGRHYRDALALTIIGAPNDAILSRIGADTLARPDADADILLPAPALALS